MHHCVCIFFFETVRSRHQIHFHLVTHIFVSIMWRHLCNPTFCCIILYIQLAHCDLYRTGCNSWLPYADMAHIICQLLKENCLFFLNHIEYFFYMLLSLSVIYISCCSCCCHQLVFHLEKMSVLWWRAVGQMISLHASHAHMLRFDSCKGGYDQPYYEIDIMGWDTHS